MKKVFFINTILLLAAGCGPSAGLGPVGRGVGISPSPQPSQTHP